MRISVAQEILTYVKMVGLIKMTKEIRNGGNDASLTTGEMLTTQAAEEHSEYVKKHAVLQVNSMTKTKVLNGFKFKKG
jgi:hypothetical protein